MEALLFLAPVLLIAIPLFSGHYVGEGLIVRFAARRVQAPRPTATAPASPPPAAAYWRPRGAELIAFSLAKRPPPALLLPQT